MSDGSPWEPILASGAADDPPRLIHRADDPPLDGETQELPADLPPRLVDALTTNGITRLWRHQATAIELARAGRHVGVVTGTASGKSLTYIVPLVERLLGDPTARVLYLAPTKALAQDQGRRLAALGLGRDLRVALVDGDTDAATRGRARREAQIILTNPDTVHHAICPHHERWSPWLADLSAIVVDEAHAYRGVFGAHVAHVIRRLRRVTALVEAAPQLLLASATVGNPHEAFARLTGLPIEVVDEDFAPTPARTTALWNPPLLDPTSGRRASRVPEAVQLVVDLILRGERVICFAPGRQLVERLLREIRDVLALRNPALAEAVSPYRAGYTPEVRRAIEARLADGSLRGVVTTSALELGIDIGHLDCAVVVGFPGSVAALRQQWGRAGRRTAGLGVLILGEDPLEQWFGRHPQSLLERPVEAVAIDPENPTIRAAHLACAAAEAPIAERDAGILGLTMVEEARSLADDPAADFAAIPAGVIWIGGDHPAGRVSLRSASPDRILIIDVADGVVLGDAERDRAPAALHPGAIHLHLGDRYQVEELDLEAGEARVRPFDGDWYTLARAAEQVDLPVTHAEQWVGSGRGGLAQAVVVSRITGYQRRRLGDHTVIDQRTLELPERRFDTVALWLTPAPTAESPSLGALHAVEHVITSAIPLAVPCDAGDLAGLSAEFHPGVGGPVVALYETHPGGIGILEEAYARLDRIVAAAAQIVADCPCRDGCPSCIQRFRCPTLNEPLDKAGAGPLLAGFLV